MDAPPSSLRAWLVADSVVEALVAIPLLLSPETLLARLGWRAIDPVSPRLLGAALLAMGLDSWWGRSQGREALRARLRLKIAWNLAAILGLVLATARNAPGLAFGILSVCLARSGVFSHYAIRMRQFAAADTRPPAEPSSDGGTDEATGG